MTPHAPLATGTLSGRVALVTGGAHGIGLGIAVALARAGARLIVTSRQSHSVNRGEWPGPALEPLVLRCDVTQPKQVDSTVNQVLDVFGRLDILVNNAAADRTARSMVELTAEEWMAPLSTNVVGAFLCTSHVCRHFVRSETLGRVINISSMAAQRPLRHRAHYGASKAALESITRAAAVEFAPSAITVNAIAPGVISTATSATMMSGSLGADDAAYLADHNSRIPMRRSGSVSDVGALAAFLASDAASYITGQVIAIDGGATL